jgi:hypothetical protein
MAQAPESYGSSLALAAGWFIRLIRLCGQISSLFLSVPSVVYLPPMVILDFSEKKG